jgi:hypothetical protein
MTLTALPRAIPECRDDVLAREELVVHRSLPQLPPCDALDIALTRALSRLRFELDRETLEYLRWKVAMNRAENDRRRSAAAIPFRDRREVQPRSG